MAGKDRYNMTKNVPHPVSGRRPYGPADPLCRRLQRQPRLQRGTGRKDKASQLEAEKGKKLTFMLPAFDYQDDSKFENQVLKAFKEQYPDIELELITASIDNWMVKLRTSASSGEAIDVFQDSANNNPMYALRGINQPLQDYIDMNNPNLHKETMDTVFCYNGNYYVAVTEPDPCVLFYNKEIFESEGLETPEELYQAGDWNFDSLARIAKQLTYSNNSGKRWGLACNYPYIFFGANATSMVKLDQNYKYTLNITDPNLMKSLEVIQDAWYTNQWEGWEGTPGTPSITAPPPCSRISNGWSRTSWRPRNTAFVILNTAWFPWPPAPTIRTA